MFPCGRPFQPRSAIIRSLLASFPLIRWIVANTRTLKPVEEWKNRRQVLGARGETIALKFLVARGWTLEAHRFKLGRNDVDLVMRKGRVVAFVEVKTRQSEVCGAAVESVTRWKQRKIGKVAICWALRHGRPGDEYRFDVIAVGGGVRPAIEHVPDAWRLDSPWLFR